MRLDLFLKRSRLIPRRALARQACAAGAVSVNGQVSKGGKSIKVGDLIECRKRNETLRVRVARLPDSGTPKTEATSLYEVLGSGEDDRDQES
ncbi:MAG: RNA-binding S4 domain-containing protein [Acidobacteria bacterium]|nr:RNA-binding S4 domain-containing protein [Acidobacteriota bacterium]